MKYFPTFAMVVAWPMLAACERQSSTVEVQPEESADEPYEVLAEQWTQEAFGALSGRLMQAIQEDGHVAAIHVCSVEADDLLGGVADARGVSIRRVTDRPRNPANEASGRDLEILQMVDAMMGSEEAFPTSISQDRVVWLPIRVAMPVCLTCHGDPEGDIAPGTLAAIGEHYPRDRATGYAEGDLRGLWRVEFPESP